MMSVNLSVTPKVSANLPRIELGSSMTRLASALTVSIFGLATATLMFCQNQAGRQPCPDVTEATMGCQLIAWSHLQEPVPLPDATSSPNRQARDQFLQTFDGTIVRSEGQYLLEVSAGVALVLHDQEIAQRYEGKRVKINGWLDTTQKMLHIGSIEAIS
jgi:uncharacterized protein DUF5818